MLELAVHNEVVDEFYLLKNHHQAWSYRLLSEALRKDVMKVVLDFVIPFLKSTEKESLWKGDSVYLFRSGLKALFAVMIHLAKTEQDIVLQACKVAVGDNLEWKKWESFISSFFLFFLKELQSVSLLNILSSVCCRVIWCVCKSYSLDW